MSHYFQNDPNLEDQVKFIKFYYRNVNLNLKTNSGVFSKNQVDFGTRLMLESLDIDFNGRRVLDLGCGYGVVGLAIAKSHPNSMVEMVDVNPRAVDLARDNKILNKVNNVKIYESNLYEKVEGVFDFIITNPPIRAGKRIVHQIIDEAFNYLKVNGSIFVVIQKKQGAPSLIKKMEEVFRNSIIINKDKSYYIIESEKSEIKNLTY